MTIPLAKSLSQALPHFTCMSVPYDPVTREVLLMWRGNNVRSAKNCLSTPAGLLEHSESFESCLLRELAEELAIPPDSCFNIEFHTIYRNSNNDGLDWVIGVWSIAVTDACQIASNVEPEKHDALASIKLEALSNPSLTTKDITFFGDMRSIPPEPMFASNLQPVLQRVAKSLINKLAKR